MKKITKKPAAKRSGKGNAAKAPNKENAQQTEKSLAALAAKWRAEIENTLTENELWIANKIPNDVVGLFAINHLEAGTEDFRIAYPEIAQSVWKEFYSHFLDVMHAIAKKLGVVVFPLDRKAPDEVDIEDFPSVFPTKVSWVRARQALDRITIDLNRIPSQYADLAAALSWVDDVRKSALSCIRHYTDSWPEIAEVSNFIDKAEIQAECDGVNTTDALAVREYLTRAKMEYTSAATRKPFNGKYQEIPGGENNMLDEMRADGNEIGQAFAYIQEAKRLRDKAKHGPGRPKNPDGASGIDLTKEDIIDAIGVIDRARKTGNLKSSYTPNMYKMKLARVLRKITTALNLKKQLIPKQLMSKAETSEEDWDDLKQDILALSI